MILGILLCSNGFSQWLTRIDSISQRTKPVYRFTVKNTDILVPLVTNGAVGLNNPQLKCWSTRIRSKVLDRINTKYGAGDYFQYFPGLALYIFDDVELKDKRSFWDNATILSGLFVLQLAVVKVLKHTIGVMRTISSFATSFTSGHTAVAFPGVGLLWKEYKDYTTWIGAAGYAFTRTTGFAWVINDKH